MLQRLQLFIIVVLLLTTISCDSNSPISDTGTTISGSSKLQITMQPTQQIITLGEPVTFSVTASGEDLLYQWKRNNKNIEGATLSIFSLPVVSMSDSGDIFSVFIFNDDASVESHKVMLKVFDNTAVPVITTQPSNTKVSANSDAIFTIKAAGKSLKYQWKQSGVDTSMGTEDSLIIPSAQETSNGTQYYCIVSNGVGKDTSKTVTLTVTEALKKGISGTIFSVSGTPASKATVKLFDYTSNSQEAAYLCTTNQSGQYYLENIKTNNYAIWIEYNGFAFFEDSIRIDSSKGYSRSDTLCKTRNIYIPIKIEKQHDPQSVSAHILGSNITSHANADSYIKFENIPLANYRIKLSSSHIDYVPTYQDIEISANSPDTLNKVILIYTGRNVSWKTRNE